MLRGQASNASASQKTNNRRTRRKNKKNNNNNSSASDHRPALTKNSQAMVLRTTDTGLRRLQRTPRSGLTDAGIAFLKCAFAPPDFQSSSIGGVPDKFCGPSLTRKHRSVNTVSMLAGTDYYFVMVPVPGSAYYVLTKPAGVSPGDTDNLIRTEYSDNASFFGGTPALTANVVTKFRFVSNHFELIPTTNQMTWSGTIQAWKIPVSMEDGIDAGVQYVTVTGLSGIAPGSAQRANQYTAPFFSGVYTGCYSASPDFPFSPIREGLGSVPLAPVGGKDFCSLVTTTNTPGLDNAFETVVIKVSGITAAQSCIIKTWACVEYQALPSSGFYEFSSLSPEDHLAIELYRKIINQLPVAVPYEMNEDFWNRVLKIIKRVSSIGSLIPGPLGDVARGVSLVTNGMENLW